VTSAKELLNRFGLRPKKSWGQNFLTDGNVQRKIVEAVGATAEDTVVEIGAGLGAITEILAQHAGSVVAIDRDPDMIKVLSDVFQNHANVDIKAMDALDFNFAIAADKAARPLRVVGNLPYQITTPILFHVLAEAAWGKVVSHAVFMVQKEVADRLAAPPGSKVYGRLSVMVQQLAQVKSLFRVSPHAFLPQPQVISSVFSLVPRAAPLAPVPSHELFAAVVRHAFGARRKMLRRALEPAFGQEPVMRALAHAGIDETRRAETLSVEEFGALTGALAQLGVTAPTPTRQDLFDAGAS
jgi:16S rRNA (adenine1518-N6/adenine1519-N6)-dimethyltransferase